MAALVESVNVGRTVEVPWGKLGRSAIDKRPTPAAVHVHGLGLDGDEIADQVFHGGPDQAVYAYSREDLAFWEADMGRSIRDGEFGENLTTSGIDLNQARAGERWRIGGPDGPLLELAGVRIPCSVFGGFVDERRWVRRFTEGCRPGPYFRVLEEGEVRAGDAIEVVEARSHDVTVELMFQALTTERDLLPRLDDEPRIASFVARRLGERGPGGRPLDLPPDDGPAAGG